MILSNNKKQKSNKWIILLTMCVNPNQTDKSYTQDEVNYRKELYINVINKWLNKTSLPIYVVESSGYTFDEIKNDRLTVFSFEGEKYGNSSLAEKYSILYALDKLKSVDCNYVLKVTGKYFLENIEYVLDQLPDDYDIYTQQHRIPGIQNSEYYGIKKELFYDFANTCCDGVMENHLYNYMLNKKVIDIPFQFSNNVARGDGSIISNL
jgi:hypothetical protein